ncbi:hypothetical protein BMS3Abin03_02634 [bacterium BMS3Abin03]|nr:hypothetical protein BMS3Abin03_02634 [bacterium BMS3Abin03]
MRKIHLIKYVLLFSLIVSAKGLAQYGSIGSVDAGSMGLAKTYTAVTKGIYSIGLNPANLILEDTLKFQIVTVLPLPTLSAIGGSNVLSMDDVNYFFGGINGESRYLNENDKQRLNSIFDNGGFLFTSASAQILSIGFIPDKKIGAFGFSITDFSGGKIGVPSALVNLVLNGNPVNKAFDLSETQAHFWWIRNYSISFARKFDDLNIGIFKNLAAGISFKLVHGYAYGSTEKVDVDFFTSSAHELSSNTDFSAVTSFSDNFGIEYAFDTLSHNSHFELFPAPAGTGFGMDLGLSFKLLDKTLISVAITDIGSITWRRNTARFTNKESLFLDDLTDRGKIDSLVDKFKADSEPAGEFSTGLATAFRFGVALFLSEFDDDNFPGHLLLAADYNQGFNNLPGNSTSPRYSFGVEWGIVDFLPYVRTGVEYSEVGGFNWAFGIGFVTSLLEIYIATNSVQTTLFPQSYSNLSMSLSSRWKFY